MDWILDEENRLSGARVATVRVRPLRLAYIIPDDDPEIALRAIHSCCLTWGGMINPLIPYSKTKGFSSMWLKILQKFDPDNLVDCVGISEDDKQQFVDKGQYVHRWDKPLESFFMVGALQYSAMNAFAKGLKDDQNQIVIQPRLDSDSDTLYLPLITKYGRIDERFLNETLKFHGVKVKVRYANFANIVEANFSTEPECIFDGTTPSVALEGKSGVIFSRDFVSLTKAGLGIQSAPYKMGGSPEESQDEEAFVNTVVVTGKSNCVTDLCLYWDLRIERQFAIHFPLWIPLQFLDTKDGLEKVQFALSRTDEKQRGLSRKPYLYIVSTSVSKKALENKLDGKLENVRFETEQLDRFISGKWDFYHVKEDKEVLFMNGSVRVSIPRCEVLKQFAPQDRVVHEISFGDIRLPQSKSLKDRIWDWPLRLTRRGFEGFSYISSWPDMVAVGIPDYWTILESIFADAGYDCEPSDKRMFALGLLRLIGSIENLGTIASSKVYETLKDMCRIKGQKHAPREFFAEREEFVYSRLRQRWGQETDVILEWLIKKGIIFRGIIVKCPKCQLSRWYELDRVNKTWRCDGCLSDQAVPLGLDSVNWKYRINELYARAHDQGAITHLLSIFALHPPAMLGDSSILGYYPGVRITAATPQVVERTKIQEMEVDLVSIRNGRLIIGECKDTGNRLTKKEVSRYVRLANHLKCSRVLFVTPASFPQAEQLFGATQKKCSALIEWWERPDVMDVSMRERMGSSKDKSISVEQKAMEYLKKLAHSLQA